MNAILTVTYNTDFFIEHQLNRIRNLCKEDDVDIFVVNNTSKNKEEVSKNIEDVCLKYDASYFFLGCTNFCGSLSHATGLNLAFNYISNTTKYERLMILDHDNIPFKEFSTNSRYDLKGLKQERGQSHVYIAPVFCSLNLNKIKNMDFMPATIEGVAMDTGAHFYSFIKNLPPENVSFVKQEHKYPDTNKFHEIIDERMFHFIRGSNWGIPASPCLSEEENAQKIKNLSEEYNKLSKGYKIK